MDLTYVLNQDFGKSRLNQDFGKTKIDESVWKKIRCTKIQACTSREISPK